MSNWLKYLRWNHLTQLGLIVQGGEEGRRLAIFNRLIVISLIWYLLLIPVSGILEIISFFRIVSLTIFMLCFCLFLNSRQYFRISKFLFISILTASAFFSSSLLELASGSFLVLVPFTALPILYYKSKTASFITLCAAIFVYLYSTRAGSGNTQIDDWKGMILMNLMVIGSTLLCYSYNIYFKLSAEEKEGVLVSLNREINRKNSRIIENINLARGIQANLLPYGHRFSSLFPESFILYKPRDIVSGDFYWVEEKGDRDYCAVIDCTGHGVPGAFVSILGHQGLNRCLHDLHLTDPSEILNKLHEIMFQVLRKEESLILDGMDVSIISYNRKTAVMNFAGAGNSMLIARLNECELSGFPLEYRGINHSLYKLPAQLQSVGSKFIKEPFSQVSIEILPSDMIYLYTDGFVDQFGGPNRKKLMHKQFRKLLLSVPQLDMAAQRRELESYFDVWRGGDGQTDDVCVIGIRLFSETAVYQ